MRKYQTECKRLVVKSLLAGEGGAKLLARERRSNRQVAAIYDIRNPNKVVVWRRQIDQGGMDDIETKGHGGHDMKPERRCQLAPNMVAATMGTGASRKRFAPQ